MSTSNNNNIVFERCKKFKHEDVKALFFVLKILFNVFISFLLFLFKRDKVNHFRPSYFLQFLPSATNLFRLRLSLSLSVLPSLNPISFSLYVTVPEISSTFLLFVGSLFTSNGVVRLISMFSSTSISFAVSRKPFQFFFPVFFVVV